MAVAAIASGVPPAVAQGPSVAEIQAREARNADTRTLVALERFRQALVTRFGAEASLAMVAFDESEAVALVVRPGGAHEFVIWRGDRWIGTQNRKLDLWAPAAVATANAFALSSLKDGPIRAWLDGWRTTPGQATDFVMRFEVGYDPAAAKVVTKARVGSLATGKIAYVVFDPASGEPLTTRAAPAPPASPPR